ncbi:MAG: electron transfer flavoprotein subunit alpha/FixB family protein [Propionibacteriaceae bacterium]|nr:electron transfer flavoprotein subunit alpha/FixB family protein [Propionibacteriaceae bacterium]
MSVILVVDNAGIGNVVEIAQALGSQPTVIAAGPKQIAEELSGSLAVTWIAADGPAEALAPAVIALAADADVVLAADRSAERALLGQVAAARSIPVLPAVTGAAGNTVSRTTLNGLVAVTEAVSGPVALLVSGAPKPVPAGSGSFQEATPAATYQVAVVSESASQQAQVDLAGASRVIGVGRGIKAEADLAMIEELAAKLGAAIACSRPIAEGVGWLPRDRYLGVSGQVIAPALYLAVGISGQVQHMVGVRGSKAVVAINSDPNAPIFNECDAGVVADLYQIVPALTAALGAS